VILNYLPKKHAKLFFSRVLTANGPAIKLVGVAERMEAVTRKAFSG